jgi:tetratricopeptide (TPR) repeat protein
MKWTRVLSLTLSAILAVVTLAAAQDDAQASMDAAKRHYRSRDYRAAITELAKTVELDPTRADALYLLGYSHLMLREYSEAVDAFGRAFQADPAFDPRTIYQAPTPAAPATPATPVTEDTT